MFALNLLAQAAPAPAASPGSPLGSNAQTIFFVTLLFIFLTAIITAVFTKWARDKSLKFFNQYHVTLERTRGQTIWGQLKVFSTGVEIVYDHPFVDTHGRKKTSFMLYGPDMETQLLCLFRYHDEMSPAEQRLRMKQIKSTFNPGPMRRMWRGVRNFVNTLRDAFSAAIGAVVTQYQRVNPTSAVFSTQGAQMTTIGQTLLGKFANAYEPLLEQYIGHPVILDVVDPINPNNKTVEYTGYLADYTQQFIAIFNVEHTTKHEIILDLPDVERGDPLPPLPPPPMPGAPAPVLPPPLKVQNDLAVRIDGLRMKIQNLRPEPVIVRKLDREGFEPIEFGMVIPSQAQLDLPARDSRNGKLHIEIIHCLDVVAPRKFATVRHAGELVPRAGLLDEIQLEFDQLPLVPKIASVFTPSTRDEAKEANLEGDVE